MSKDPGTDTAQLYADFRPVDLTAAKKFLTANHHGVLTTRKKDGGVQMSPITPGLDETGRVIISSRETAYKVNNLRHDPRAAVCVFAPSFHGEGWVQVNGTAEIISRPEAINSLIYLYRQVYGEHKSWEEFYQRMERERRVIIRITIESVGPRRRG
ncbi:MAG: PPOX class F420-dependent oxidoreductase [Deltaproteobacteria bacterium]|nr:PPOX class F420-dependent oxidoreductase [Deltaproteobacteria bacterium]